jgi:hypothetical protein
MAISNIEFQRLHQFLYLETSSKIPVVENFSPKTLTKEKVRVFIALSSALW